MDIIWKKIDGFSNYSVSNDGNIKSHEHKYVRKDGVCGTRKEKILSTKKSDKSKYINVVLKNDDGEVRNINLHTIVASAFCEKPKSDEKLIVNHKDGNKHNNNSDNLEWATYSYNNSHAFEYGLKSNRHRYKKCKITYLDGSVEYYESVKDLSEGIGIPKGTITSSLSRNTNLKDGSKIEYI